MGDGGKLGRLIYLVKCLWCYKLVKVATGDSARALSEHAGVCEARPEGC